jgi:hypothetical protein
MRKSYLTSQKQLMTFTKLRQNKTATNFIFSESAAAVIFGGQISAQSRCA